MGCARWGGVGMARSVGAVMVDRLHAFLVRGVGRSGVLAGEVTRR